MMKKIWKTPVCNTVVAKDLMEYIKAAAWSGESGCRWGVFR